MPLNCCVFFFFFCFFSYQKLRTATGVVNEKKHNLEDVSELQCDTKRLHSAKSFQFSVFQVSEPDGDRMRCSDIGVAGRSAACPTLLTGNLNLCKFRNADLNSHKRKEKTDRITMSMGKTYTGWDAKKACVNLVLKSPTGTAIKTMQQNQGSACYCLHSAKLHHNARTNLCWES